MFCKVSLEPRYYAAEDLTFMPEWPKTRVTLLGRLGDPHDKDAWEEF